MKMKISYDPGAADQAELLEELRLTNLGGQLQELTSWTQASEIEQGNWARAEKSSGARVRGGMYDLVEQLISDRAFEREAGVYLEAGAELEDLVYAARRLLAAGQKVVLIDWDVTRGAGEELLSSEIPVIDIHQGGDPLVDLAAGRVELPVEAGADEMEWLMTVDRAAELIRQLPGVDVVVFLAEDTATEHLELEEDTVSMSASTVANLAGSWGASILVARADAKTFQVLAHQLEMTWQELS